MSNEFNWVEFISHKADELITHGIGSHTLSMAFTLGVAGVLHRTGHLKTLWSLAHGGISRDATTLQRTDYFPTGIENRETGKEFRDQKITVIDSVSPDKIFDEKLGRVLAKSFAKAVKSASEEGASPLVLSHLPQFFGEKIWEGLKPEMQRQSIVFFSDLYNDVASVGTAEYAPNQRPVERYVLPLPVIEAGNEDKPTLKWISVFIKDGELKELPAMENTRFKTGFGKDGMVFEPGAHQQEADRLRLMQRVYAELQKPENEWLWGFSTQVFDGETLELSQNA